MFLEAFTRAFKTLSRFLVLTGWGFLDFKPIRYLWLYFSIDFSSLKFLGLIEGFSRGFYSVSREHWGGPEPQKGLHVDSKKSLITLIRIHLSSLAHRVVKFGLSELE